MTVDCRSRPCAALFAILLFAAGPSAACAGEEDPDPFSGEFRFSRDFDLEAPNPIRRGDVLYLTEGFVLRMEERTLIGDALRWDEADDQLFATGHVVMSQPGLRLEADSLGLRRHPVDEEGMALVDGEVAGRLPFTVEAWNARVRLRFPETGRILRMRARLVQLLPDRIILHRGEADGSHGSWFGFSTDRLVIDLRPEEKPERRGFERHVEDLTVWNPTVYLWDVPILWLPVLYRDFRVDYPWTRFEFGRSDRLGDFARAWVGFTLPIYDPTSDREKRAALNRRFERWALERRLQMEEPLTPEEEAAIRARLILVEQDRYRDEELRPRWYHWRVRAEGRADHHSRAGEAFGARARWEHGRYGEGQYLWYGFGAERVFAPKGFGRAFAEGPGTLGRFLGARMFAEGDDRPALIERSAHVVDAEHRVSYPGGGAYGRWVDLPDADPITPDLLDPTRLFAAPETRPPDERFRDDFLSEDLEKRPLARRGITAAYTFPAMSFVADTEFKPHPDLHATERELGIQAELPVTSVLGPIHLGGNAWAERLVREQSPKRQVGATWQRQEADRLNFDVHAGGTKWIAGVGIDAAYGLRGLFYDDAERTVRQRQPTADFVTGFLDSVFDPGSLEVRRQRGFGTIREIDRDFADDQFRRVRYFEGGVRLRAEGDWGESRHVFTPRVGVEISTPVDGEVDDWKRFDFADGRDELEADRRLLVAGFNTTFGDSKRTVVSADLTTRWAVRDEERTIDRELSPQEQILLDRSIGGFRTGIDTLLDSFFANYPAIGRRVIRDEFGRRFVDDRLARLRRDFPREVVGTRLVEVSGRLEVIPGSDLTLTGNFTWDNLRENFSNLTVTASYIPHERVRLRYLAVWLPETSIPDLERQLLNNTLVAIDPLLAIDTDDRISENWQHTFGATVIANRYRFGSEIRMRPRGDLFDSLRLSVGRAMVDGTVALNYELNRDQDGRLIEQDVSVSVSLFGFDLN